MSFEDPTQTGLTLQATADASISNHARKGHAASNAASNSTAKKVPLGRISQGRRDALNGRWVIFAPGRSERPAEILEAELPTPLSHSCPFCAGNESHTPPATLAFRDADSDELEWTVRVVPNLFPAVSPSHLCAEARATDGQRSEQIAATELAGLQHWNDPDSVLHQLLTPQRRNIHFGAASVQHLASEHLASEQLASDGESSWQQDVMTDDWSSSRQSESDFDSQATGKSPTTAGGDGEPDQLHSNLFEYCELHGGHEVIVETPQHVESITSLSEAHVAQVFEAYAERIRHWLAMPGVRYVVAFKNAGAAAGASLRHTHSQLIATSLLPPAVEEIGARIRQHRSNTGNCLLCDMLAGERSASSRIICETKNYVAYCPFASRLPYLVRVAPKVHQMCFEENSEDAMRELAKLTQQIVGALESMFVACSYNYTIHTRPVGLPDQQAFHWWMEIFPRLTKVAGFEWGSDCYINPVTPEVAAEHFRTACSF